MILSSAKIWTVIILLGLGSFALRFLFLGLIGDRRLPDWLMRHLRYTAVAIMPALVAPMLLTAPASSEAIDPVRLVAAGVTFAVAYFTRPAVHNPPAALRGCLAP
mgnify:CR=1 FL=1